MDRPYDDIPRQGEHKSDALDTEPSTNVRAQQPVRPHEKSKETRAIHVLTVDRDRDLYRLRRVPKERAGEEDERFEELARVPEGGDLGGLFERIPDLSKHAVFENTESGTRFFSAQRRLSHDWAGEGEFDQVTIFKDKDDATAYAEAVQDGESAK